MTENLYSLFAERFAADPTGPAIEMPDGKIYTFSEMEEAAGRFASLLTELGVAPGDRVAVQVAKSPDAVFLYLACLRMGAIYLPLNTAFTGAEIDYFLGDASPSVFVCMPDAEAELAPIASRNDVRHVLTLDDAGGGTAADRTSSIGTESSIADLGAQDIAAILYTSGTTGRSKGTMLSHRNLASNALTLHRIWGWRPGDVLLHALPIFHVHGLFVAMHCAFLNGSKMLFLPHFNPDDVIRLLPDTTVFMGVPTFYIRLLARNDFTRESCRSMRLFISGSAPLLPETFRSFQERTGHAILERYGMTEAGMITSNPLEGDRVAGTVGPPLPGVEARVASDSGEVLPTGQVGVLEIKGPNVFEGYWRMPDKTKEDFRPDGFFITGDLATISETCVVSIVGRAKDLIISGGENVYPKEIESVIDGLDGVAESAVIGLPHPDFGEAVAAIIKPETPGGAGLTEAEMLTELKGQLARFKMPKRIFFIDELPRNAMGKVQKNTLRDTFCGTFVDD